MLKLSLNDIRKHYPCKDGWETLLKSKGNTTADDVKFPLMDVLESNNIKDAVWCLRCFDYKEYCLFLADVAESVLPIFENEYPDNSAPRDAINAIRNYHIGLINKDELKVIGAAYAAATATTAVAAYAAATATTAVAAYATATTVADVDDVAYATATTAAYAADVDDVAYAATAATTAAYAAADVDDVAYAADTYAAADAVWQEIEKLFIKHFGE